MLLAWNPPPQSQTSINKLSEPEGVHVCVCVWVCVSPVSCDWSHEYGGAPGFVQSLTRSIKPQMRASEWERRRCRCHGRLDSNPEPALDLLWPRPVQVDFKLMLAWGRKVWLGCANPKKLDYTSKQTAENHTFQWIHFTVPIKVQLFVCWKYNISQIIPEGQLSKTFSCSWAGWLFNVGCYYSAHYFLPPFLDRCSAFPPPNVNSLAGSLLAERPPPSVCAEPVTAWMPRSGFRLRTCAVPLPATLHCLWDGGSHWFLGWFFAASMVVPFIFSSLLEVTSESIVFMSLWYTGL